MSRNPLKYSLPHKEVLPYFINHITSEMSLGKIIEEQTDFTKGSFFTYLPDNVNSDQLLSFEHGGIIPSISMNGQKDDRYISMSTFCGQYIQKILNKNSFSKLIVEDYNRTGYSPIKLENVELNTIDQEIYHILSNKNSQVDISRVIRRCSIGWHFLAFLTKNTDFFSSLDRSNIHSVCNDVQLIVTCAYDDESYIFWKKTSID